MASLGRTNGRALRLWTGQSSRIERNPHPRTYRARFPNPRAIASRRRLGNGNTFVTDPRCDVAMDFGRSDRGGGSASGRGRLDGDAKSLRE